MEIACDMAQSHRNQPSSQILGGSAAAGPALQEDSANGKQEVSDPLPLHHKDTIRSQQSLPRAVQSTSPAPTGHSTSPILSSRTGDLPSQTELRSLPLCDLTNETIDSAYVAFILYCNPSVPSTVNTYELRKCFRNPPRSDGKSFSIFTLWKLIGMLDRKELKTWVQLSMELGVERPSPEKKQSAQKVQQYAVRLKRWMRAMHIDAFFEYCLGHAHPYYTQLPEPDSPADESRDGVPLAEDLALRALLPECKPKRGRKRTERSFDEDTYTNELDNSEMSLQPAASDARLATFPRNPAAFDARADQTESNDPWMTAASSFNSNGPSNAAISRVNRDLLWKPLDRDISPAEQPQPTAVAMQQRTSDVQSLVELKSAITSSSSSEKPRLRKRHGPAVSSAWLSGSGSPRKTRGRPPNKDSNRGPFSSFPAKPGGTISSYQEYSAKQPLRATLDDSPVGQHAQEPYSSADFRQIKVQLQVSKDFSTQTHIATPPASSVLQVNDSKPGHSPDSGETNSRDGQSILRDQTMSSEGNRDNGSKEEPTTTDVVQALAKTLLSGKIVGRSYPLQPNEAFALASAMVSGLSMSYTPTSVTPPALMAALQLGQGQHFGLVDVAPKHITVSVSRVPYTSSDENEALNDICAVSYEYKQAPQITTRITCTGVCLRDNGRSEITGINSREERPDEAAKTESERVLSEDDMPGKSWKQRYHELRKELQKKERALSQYKRKIMESVMADI